MKYYVIGAGSIGKRHFENLTALGANATLLPWRGLSLDGFAEQLQSNASQSTAIIIATASQIRMPLIQLAAQTESPLYIEKPLAYRLSDLDAIYDASRQISSRSMVGFMMRYHPVVKSLAARGMEQTYSFAMEIGHDVRQWRNNWRFDDSYAANADGGGVLLDLCHELDIANLLFPNAQLKRVDSLGHVDYPGVDFSSRITLTEPNGAIGTIAMDYLSPHSLRRITLRGRKSVSDIDLLAGSEDISDGRTTRTIQHSQERNTMFLDIMRDFMILAETGRQPENQIAPVMDKVYDSCKLIAQAWEARQFNGAISGDKS